MDKKKLQLGMNPSTASHRLVKDILFERVVTNEVCHHCGKPMTRDDFSIEHKEPWLDSDDPVGNYFDQDNIAFSHLSCNVTAARRPHRLDLTESERQAYNRRAWRRSKRKHYDPAKRHHKYIQTGQ